MPNVKVALLLALYGSFDTMAASSKQTLAPARQGKAWHGISPNVCALVTAHNAPSVHSLTGNDTTGVPQRGAMPSPLGDSCYFSTTTF